MSKVLVLPLYEHLSGLNLSPASHAFLMVSNRCYVVPLLTLVPLHRLHKGMHQECQLGCDPYAHKRYQTALIVQRASSKSSTS